MKGNSDFDLDLPIGKVAEELAHLLVADSDRLTVEVKRDCEVSETGNVAIEYRYKGALSGIAVSKAAWWAIAFSGPGYDDNSGTPELILFIRRKRLLRLLRILRDRGQLKPTKGGDGKQSEMALVTPFRLLMPLANLEDETALDH